MATSTFWNLLDRPGPHSTENFVPGEDTKEMLRSMLRVLVVGAGGLGCELLKDLVLLGFMNIDVIDMDRIEVTNLNRQFLFRKSDVGQPKAEVAARFVNQRLPGAKINPHFCRLEEKSSSFYSSFHLVVLGLDSIDARRWINDMFCSLVQRDEEGRVLEQSSVPIIDGGTEGFKGHVRVIRPGISACFECTLDLFPPQEHFPLCTLAEIPRSAAHCIEWAKLIRWPEIHPNSVLDLDNGAHMQWLYEAALARAEEFGIEGVTLRYTQGVAKNIIPAIASTNAIVAAACANEAFKLATGVSKNLDDYLLFMGGEGIYTNVHKPERKPDCLACGAIYTLRIPRGMTVSSFLHLLGEEPRFQCKAPSLATADKVIYMRGALEQQYRANLDLLMISFLGAADTEGGTFISVTDPSFSRAVQLCIKWEE